MTGITHHSSTLTFERTVVFDGDRLGRMVAKAMSALDETGCSAPRATASGVEMSGDTLTLALSVSFVAQHTNLSVTLHAPGLSEDCAHAKLAGAICHLASEMPADHIDWLDCGVSLECANYLEIVAPQSDTADHGTVPPVAPSRVAVGAPKTRRPDALTHKRLLAQMLPQSPVGFDVHSTPANDAIDPDRFDAHVRTYQANLRFCLLREAEPSELHELREEQGRPSTPERISTWALSLTLATVSLPIGAPVMIYNVARGEDMRVASLATGVAGLFVALDMSGAMAGVLAAF